jgi:hypothetical protein
MKANFVSYRADQRSLAYTRRNILQLSPLRDRVRAKITTARSVINKRILFIVRRATRQAINKPRELTSFSSRADLRAIHHGIRGEQAFTTLPDGPLPAIACTASSADFHRAIASGFERSLLRPRLLL